MTSLSETVAATPLEAFEPEDLNRIVFDEVHGDHVTLSEFVERQIERDEVGDAQIYAKLNEGSLMYDHSATTKSPWMWYNNGVWQYDELWRIKTDLVNTLERFYTQRYHERCNNILQLVTDQDAAKLTGDAKKSYEVACRKRDYVLKRIRMLHKEKRVGNVLRLLSALKSISTTSKQLDSDPLLINLKNGTFNLTKADWGFRQFRHCDKLTKQAGAEYKVQAECPFFAQFLNTIFCGDTDTIQFVQQFFGVCLTGKSDVDVLFYAYGGGSNGKTTLLEIMRLLLRDYCVTMGIENLIAKQRSSSDEYSLLRLKGARLAISSEIPEGRMINEALIKTLTGGDEIHARPIYGSPLSFTPSHKLVFCGNHKLRMRGTDDGIWRRVILVEFKFSSKNLLPEKIMTRSEILQNAERELSGILNWALEGLKMYYQGGLQIPKAVSDATREYREEFDELSPFLDECCLSDPANPTHLQVNQLFTLYIEWRGNNAVQSQISRIQDFSAQLRRRGFTVEKGGGNKTFVKGLRLKSLRTSYERYASKQQPLANG